MLTYIHVDIYMKYIYDIYMKIYVGTKTCRKAFIATLCTRDENCKQSKCSVTAERINKI